MKLIKYFIFLWHQYSRAIIKDGTIYLYVSRYKAFITVLVIVRISVAYSSRKTEHTAFPKQKLPKYK